MLLALPLALAAQSQTNSGAQPAQPTQGQPAPTQPVQDEPEFSITGQQGSLLHLEVRRVPVDVVVTDSEGNPVRGLTKDDFVLKEDHAVQDLLSFDYFDGSLPSFVPRKIPVLPVNTYVNLPAEPEQGPLYVLYYDMVNTFPEDQGTCHKQLLDFIDKARPGTRIAIFVNAERLRLIQGFTSDHALLRAAIGTKGPGPHIPAQFLYGENFGRQDMGAAISNLQFIAEYLRGIAGRKNLIWLADKCPVPQGPNFAAISGNEIMNKEAYVVRDAFSAMMRSQIAIYPVDLKGAVTYAENSQSPAGDADQNPSSMGEFGPHNRGATGGGGAGGLGGIGIAGAGENIETGSSASVAGQTLGLSGYSVTSVDQFREEYIARSTGGHAYYANNDVSGALNNATETGMSYYTLSYAPTNANFDGSDRHIEITLAKKSGYKLSYRNLYYAMPDDGLPTMEKTNAVQARFVSAKAADTLYANIEHGAPMLHDLLFSAHLRVAGAPMMATPEQMMQLEDSPAFFRTRHKDQPRKPLAPVKLQKYLIEYGIFDPQLKARSGDSEQPAKLEFAAAAYDADGRLLNSILNEGLTSNEADANGQSGALFHAEQELEVPPGAASIRIAVRDKLNDRTGTYEVPLPLKPEMRTEQAKKVD
jgi:VWFA-related protein